MKPLAARSRKAVTRVSRLVSRENHWWRPRSLQKKCLTALSRLPAAGRRFTSPRGETCRLAGFLLPLLFCTFAAASVTVVVEDPGGDRVAGARVALQTSVGREIETRRTSDAGEASFEGNQAGRIVEVAADGFEPQLVLVADDETLIVRLAIATVATTIEVEAEAEPSVAVQETGASELAAIPSTDLIENLRATPGVNVLRRGATNIEPVVQGLRETQLAMVVDGTRTFAAGPARMDSELSHVEPGHISSVEVVTGPYALTKAAGALGAILVHSPQVPRFDRWQFGGGTASGYRSNGSGRYGRARLFAGDNRFGFSLRAAGNQGNDYRAGARGPVKDITVPGDFSNHQFGGKLRFNPAGNQEIALGGFYDEQTGVDYPGRLLTAEHFILRSFSGNYYAANPADGITAIKGNIYLNKKSHRMSNREKPTARPMMGRTPSFALDVALPTEADTLGGSGSVEFALTETWRLQTGFDFYHLNQDAQRYVARQRDGRLLFSDAVWPDATINDQGVYVQTVGAFERGEVAAGARADFVQADAGRPSDFFLANAGQGIGRNETNFNASLAGRYRLTDGVSLSAGVGNVRRTANALERFSDRFPSTRFQIAAEFMGLPAIQPESSTQGNLNVDVSVRDFRFSAGGFLRRINDYITVRPDPDLPKRLPLSPPVVFRYINGDHATFRGYQLGAEYRGSRWFQFRSRAAKVIADDRELNEPVLGIAPFEVYSSVRILEPSGRFWSEYSVRNVWDQQRVSIRRLETPSPGFTTHDLRFGAAVHKKITLHFGVENLGDKHYFEHLNSPNPFTRQRIPEPGRAVYLSLTTNW